MKPHVRALPLRVTHRPLNDWALTLPEDREAAVELPKRRARRVRHSK